jgi:TP901-1 family phage major tail protein
MPINGKVVVLKVEDPAGSDTYTEVGGQRDMTITQTREEIDASSKDSSDQVTLPGLATREISMDSLYLPNDQAAALLQTAFDNAQNIRVEVYDGTSGSTSREADSSVLEMSENHPDEDVSTWSVRLKVSGGFVPGTATP